MSSTSTSTSSPSASPSSGWYEGGHRLFEPRLFTEDDVRAPDPKGFEGHLYPPQATLLHAMLQIAGRPLLSIQPNIGREDQFNIGSADSFVIGEDNYLHTKEVRFRPLRVLIGEELSFGKTVLSIAYILACKEAQRQKSDLPSRLPTPIPTMSMNTTNDGNLGAIPKTRHTGRGYVFDLRGQGFVPIVEARFRRHLPITLVIAQPSVISEWEDNLLKFAPSLTYTVIDHVRTLKAFRTLIETDKVVSIDVVLMKIGRVTTSYVVPGENTRGQFFDGGRSARPITAGYAAVTQHLLVENLFIDDYDLLKTCAEDYFPPALMTWIISATRRVNSACSSRLVSAPTVQEYLRRNAFRFPIAAASLDDIVHGCLTLRCEPEYVHNYINTTCVGYRRVVVKGGQAARILENLGAPAGVVDAVNAGAFRTAAEHYGIVATSVGDIVMHVLGRHDAKYRQAVRVHARADEAQRIAGDRLGDEAFHPVDKEAVTHIRATLKKGSEAEVQQVFEHIGGSTPAFRESLDSLREWAEKECEEHGRFLTRLRDNVREQHCQSCYCPIAGASYILNGCCQIVICEACAIEDVSQKNRRFIQKCPNCAKAVAVGRDLIYVGEEVDLSRTLDDGDILAVKEESAAVDPRGDTTPAESAGGSYADIDDPRLRAIAQIVDEVAPDCVEDAPSDGDHLVGLIAGKISVPLTAAAQRKFLIYGIESETTREIAKMLRRRGKSCLVLQGTVAQKTAMKHQFRDSAAATIMIVTGSEGVAGMHLPFVTHVIESHKIRDTNVESQAVARAHRTGRQFNLQVIRVWNEAEAGMI